MTVPPLTTLAVLAEPADVPAELPAGLPADELAAGADVDALVERARRGDAEVFGELFERFQGPIYRQLFFLTRSVAVAEDLTSETFFRALRAMQRAQMPGSYFGPWLRRIARNLAIDHAGSWTTRTERSTPDYAAWPDLGALDPGITGAEDADLLRDALTRLPESQRRVLALRFLCQLSIDETAAELGCTYGAAKQLQWRGLRNLERLLGEAGGADHRTHEGRSLVSLEKGKAPATPGDPRGDLA